MHGSRPSRHLWLFMLSSFCSALPSQDKTYLLALLISIMSVYSPAYTIGVPFLGSGSGPVVRRWTWVRLFAELSPRNGVERALVFPAIGTVLGCWLGIIPIALDWDRPWQAWPLTPAFGAITGYIISSMAALSVNAVINAAHERSRALTPQRKNLNNRFRVNLLYPGRNR
ncbi:GPI biosynthesis protein family Pig-F-domain-containing protein [Pholiota molesta]|nr:GPI biosynthesis protein family Pig-F-domain-containing protein [Pholiota molesta]